MQRHALRLLDGFWRLAAVSGAIGVMDASPVHAATITRHCNPTYCDMQFQGDIKPGDAQRIARLVRDSPKVVEEVVINSPGGDPFEALAISDTLNRNFIGVHTGECRPGSGSCVFVYRGMTCSSACALVYLTADERLGTEVFLHRPTFPPASFAALSGPLAEHAYDATVDRLLAELRRRHVSEDLLQAMMLIPSSEVRKLSAPYPMFSPWLAEWLDAKCGPLPPDSDPRTDENWVDHSISHAVAHGACEGESIEAEARRVQGKS